MGAQGEVVDQVVEFGDKKGFGPEGGVAGFFAQVCGVAVAKLVVEEDGDGVVGC